MASPPTNQILCKNRNVSMSTSFISQTRICKSAAIVIIERVCRQFFIHTQHLMHSLSSRNECKIDILLTCN